MGGVMNSIGWVGLGGWGDVSVGLCLLPPAGLPTTLLPCYWMSRPGRRELLFTYGGGWQEGGCAGCCRLERKSVGIAWRQLRRVWVWLARAATVSGKQAPAPPTAMPAVHRLAEVIMQRSKCKRTRNLRSGQCGVPTHTFRQESFSRYIKKMRPKGVRGHCSVRHIWTWAASRYNCATCA